MRRFERTLTFLQAKGIDPGAGTKIIAVCRKNPEPARRPCDQATHFGLARGQAVKMTLARPQGAHSPFRAVSLLATNTLWSIVASSPPLMLDANSRALA